MRRWGAPARHSRRLWKMPQRIQKRRRTYAQAAVQVQAEEKPEVPPPVFNTSSSEGKKPEATFFGFGFGRPESVSAGSSEGKKPGDIGFGFDKSRDQIV